MVYVGPLDLEFKLKRHGGYVYDVRDRKNPKVVGLIVETAVGRGYTLCPFVQQTIEFDAPVPEQVKSPQKMQHWVMEHAVMWKAARKYTIFNNVMRIFGPIPRVLHVLRDVRLSVIGLQLLFIFWITRNNLPKRVYGWIVLMILFTWAVFNIVCLCKDHKIFDRKF